MQVTLSDKDFDYLDSNKKEFVNNFSNPDVLIAGCGTGKHLAHTIYYENANISAIDLSLSSIAYAKRMIEKIGYENNKLKVIEDNLNWNWRHPGYRVLEFWPLIHDVDEKIFSIK